MWQVYHGGYGCEKVGEASQAATGQIPHAVLGPVQFCSEEHQCVVLQEKHRGSYNNTSQNVRFGT